MIIPVSHFDQRNGRRALIPPASSFTTIPESGPQSERTRDKDVQRIEDGLIGRHDFPIVCVGGSAGGLDAYIQLLQHLPNDTGVAVVIVNHLRHVATYLHEILPKYTKMPVELITEGLTIEPNHVFIIPEQRDLHVKDGKFELRPISKPRGWPDVITVFLQSLTHFWDGNLVAVIVSGYDGDGADALCGIKDVGGVTIAQKLDTAEHPDMPESAIASGCIDYILAPDAIARKIQEIAR